MEEALVDGFVISLRPTRTATRVRRNLPGHDIPPIPPSRYNQREPIHYKEDICKHLNHMECMSSRLKNLLRIKMSYDRPEKAFLCVLILIATELCFLVFVHRTQLIRSGDRSCHDNLNQYIRRAHLTLTGRS